MNGRGFSLVELLVALAVCALISGAVAAAVEPARAAFFQAPSAIDLEQRGRTALEMLTTVIRSAGRTVVAAHTLAALPELVPPVRLGDPDASGQRFSELTVITPVANPGQATLAFDQVSAGGSLMLAEAWCPAVNDVCGFTPGATIAIADGPGHFDVGVVAGANAGLRRLSLTAALSRAYPAGSIVVEVDALTYKLAAQPDGTSTLVRQTAAGAVQPIIDGVADLWFEPEPVADGDGQPGVRRIVVHARLLILESVDHGPPGERVFQTSVTLRNVP